MNLISALTRLFRFNSSFEYGLKDQIHMKTMDTILLWTEKSIQVPRLCNKTASI